MEINKVQLGARAVAVSLGHLALYVNVKTLLNLFILAVLVPKMIHKNVLGTLRFLQRLV